MQATPKQYAEAWKELLAESSAAKRKTISKRVLSHVRRTNRMRLLPDIVRRMEAIVRRESGDEAVTVRSSRALTASEARALAAEVMGSTPSSVALRIDPGLLGGVRIETADSRWDVSLATQLAKLHNRLIA